MRGVRLIWLLLLCFAIACSEQSGLPYEPEYAKNPKLGRNTYIFGVHPLHNPQKLFELYGPLVDYLNANLNIPDCEIALEASRNYPVYDEKLKSGHYHFGLPNPYQTVRSLKYGYRIFGKMDNDKDFRGIIIVRKDSGIEKPEDLRGKTISYPAATALAAAMMPQLWLTEHGLDVMRETVTQYVGTHDSSIMNAYLGKSQASCTWPPPWRAFVKENPDYARELSVKWQTQTLPNNGLIVREDVPQALSERVAELMFGLSGNPQGQILLNAIGVNGFVAADTETYLPVFEFMRVFEAKVRPIED